MYWFSPPLKSSKQNSSSAYVRCSAEKVETVFSMGRRSSWMGSQGAATGVNWSIF